MSDLFSLLEDISDQLPNCTMVSIVSLDSGMQLASEAEDAAKAMPTTPIYMARSASCSR